MSAPTLPEPTTCTCCGRAITTGHTVPFIGVVGPTCHAQFATLAPILGFLAGQGPAPTPAHAAALGRLRNRLTALGIQVTTVDGTLAVTRATRTPKQIAKSYKQRRAEFERDLQVASGLYGLKEHAA